MIEYDDLLNINKQVIMPDNYRRIKDALAKLPNSSYEIAATLEKLGIQGYKKSLSACPLARYITKTCNVDTFVMWNRISVWGDVCYLPTDRSISQFIKDFDSGHFPEIEEKV